MKIILTEFYRMIETYSNAIEIDQPLSPGQYLTVGRLWNTVSYHRELMEMPSGKRFFEIVRDKGIPKMVNALNMIVSRGYSFYSEEYDFMLGGTMEERFRYRITDL